MYSISEMDPRIKIHILGDPKFYIDDALVYPPINVLRILVFVLVEGRGRPVARRRIGSMIWSDNPSDQVNADVRQTVVRMRRFQDEHKFQLLSNDATMVWLNSGQSAYIDLMEFQNLIDKPGPKSWVRLCEIYNGDLLGSHRHAGEVFEEWLEHQRTAMRFDYINSISQAVLPTSLLSHQERHFCASRLLVEDPYHEGAHRALMYEAAMKGEYSFLRHLFEKCREVLRKELGISPTQETINLYESLMSRAPVA